MILITGFYTEHRNCSCKTGENDSGPAKELDKIQSNIEQENELNKKLLQQKQEVKSDEYIEKIARENLGMIKDGEKIFIDVD